MQTRRRIQLDHNATKSGHTIPKLTSMIAPQKSDRALLDPSGEPGLIGLPRSRDDTVRRRDVAQGQLVLHLFRFLLHSQPAQFADQFDELVRCSLLGRAIARLLLFAPYFHGRSPMCFQLGRMHPACDSRNAVGTVVVLKPFLPATEKPLEDDTLANCTHP